MRRYCAVLPRSVGSPQPLSPTSCPSPGFELHCLHFVCIPALFSVQLWLSSPPAFQLQGSQAEALSEYKCKHILPLERRDISMRGGCSVTCQIFGAGTKTFALQLPNVGTIIHFRTLKSKNMFVTLFMLVCSCG